MVNVFKAFFKDQSVYKELTKISSPLKPIASAYDKLDDHVRELTNLLCSCKFTFNVVVTEVVVMMMMMLKALVMMVVMMVMVVVVIEVVMMTVTYVGTGDDGDDGDDGGDDGDDGGDDDGGDCGDIREFIRQLLKGKLYFEFLQSRRTLVKI